MSLLLLPLVAMPPFALKLVSPQASRIYALALPGWPEQRPFAEALSDLELPLAGSPGDASAARWRPNALVPYDTLMTLSLGTAYVVVAALVAFYPWPGGGVAVLARLGTALIGLAVLQSLYAFVQQSAGLHQTLWYECLPSTSCTGTFLNRNHFSGLLEMVVPLVLARAGMAFVQIPRSLFGRRKRWVDLLDLLSNPHAGRALVYVAIAVILIVGLAISGSRSAFVVTLGSLAIMVSLRPSRRHAARATRSFGLPIALALLAALWLTFPQLRQRLSLSDPSRVALAADAGTMAADFPVLGVGLGNFGTTYTYYRSVPLDLWAFGLEHAHNDYLEWLAEAGVPAALLSTALLFWLGARVVQKLRQRAARTRAAWMLWGWSTGVVALLLHGLTDSNLHVPANALVFAFLVGGIVRLTRTPRAAEPEASRPSPGLRAVGGAGALCALVWGALVWNTWEAEAAYRQVYPDIAVRDLTDHGDPLSGAEALSLAASAAGRVPGAPQFQAGLGRQLARRASAERSDAKRAAATLDAAISAFLRSVGDAPLQPGAMLDLVAVLEARSGSGDDGALSVLDDLVDRAAALSGRDSGTRLRAAEWYLERWDALSALQRARAEIRVEEALVLAERTKVLDSRRASLLEAFRRVRDGRSE